MSESIGKKNIFFVEIDAGQKQTIEVATGVYQLAAIASLAILGCDHAKTENIVKIWSQDNVSSNEPFFFIWSAGAIGQLSGSDPRKW